MNWDHGKLRLKQTEQLTEDEFFQSLQDALNNSDKNSKDSLIFIHGYNVSFEQAAIRAAQLGVDLKVPGETAFFSWPSKASEAAYPDDEATVEVSEGALTEFLTKFAQKSGAGKIHIIAHSMGNRALIRALDRVTQSAGDLSKFKFGQIFLAAPDIDRDLFIQLAACYSKCSERTTLYASRSDWAVWLSAKLHGAPRAGYFEPYTIAKGIDTIAVPNFNLDKLGHSYFAQAEALLHDIFDLMRHGTDPDSRQRLEPAFSDGQKFWQLNR